MTILHNNCSAKRSRGRPPKIQVCVKSKRGRPRKNIISVESNVPKKRGRPRKIAIIVKSNVPKNSKTVKSFQHSENKMFFNTMFSNHIVDSLQYNRDFYVGALDSVERNTSSALQNVGIPIENILLVERERYIYDSHVSAGYNVFEVGKDGLTDFSNQHYKRQNSSFNWTTSKCAGWCFDTCGEVTCQKNGILKTISKLDLLTGAILSFTFCQRTTGGSYEDHKQLFLRELAHCLLDKNFIFEKIIDRDYSGKKFFERSHNDSMMNTIIIKIKQLYDNYW
jgi:hypothetical protein